MIRCWKFNAVGWMGAGVQLAALALAIAAGMSTLPATALAVETALVHNYVWHTRWTWRGRESRFWRFQISNGLISLLSNLLLTQTLAAWTGLPAIAANAVAIAATGLLNFWIGDRWVFPASGAGPRPARVTLPAATVTRA